LLGEFVLPGGGTAWTSAVLASFARLGIEEKTTRQALMRTAASGWLGPEKVGRRTRWRLTASAGPAMPNRSGSGSTTQADRPEGLCRARHKCYKEMSDSEVLVE
jgi:hypothetical protein